MIFSKNGSIIFLLLTAALSAAAAVWVYGFLKRTGESIILDDSDIPVIIPNAAECSSNYAAMSVIAEFKENNPIYKSILPKSAGRHELKNAAPLFYDSGTKLYICSGIIEIQSSKDGFRPAELNEDNLFYAFAAENNGRQLRKYTFYEQSVKFISQENSDGSLVKIIRQEKGVFGCRGNCMPVILLKENHSENPPKIHVEVIEKPDLNKNDDTPPKKIKPKERLKKFFNFFRRN